MRDYWLTQYLLAAVGWAYLLLVALALGVALWLPAKWVYKAIGAITVLTLASVLPYQGYREYLQEQEAQTAYQKRFAVARQLYDEKCKSAGEKIYRTAKGVKGILLLKVRPERGSSSLSDPNWPDAGLPNEFGGSWYLISFLGWEQGQGDGTGSVNVVPTKHAGYEFLDVARSGGRVERFLLEEAANGRRVLASAEAGGASTASYAVDYENDLDPNLRKNWIAGTRILVLDMRTKELLAERQSYSFEPGLGSTAGGRSPWLFAVSCPENVSGSQTRYFIEKVLRKGE